LSGSSESTAVTFSGHELVVKFDEAMTEYQVSGHGEIRFGRTLIVLGVEGIEIAGRRIEDPCVDHVIDLEGGVVVGSISRRR